jgi:hypothetical protein
MKTGTLLASVLVVGSAVGHMATPSAVTACYEGGGPAEGYVHKETNLDFTVDRSSEKSVAFTESYNKFEGVSCSAVPAHKFGETAWCNTNGALCNRECPMSMPQKCADVDSFGVCTPTVKDICDTLQGSRDSCTSSSDAAQAKADDYLTVDVRASPCDGDEQSSTLNALKAYKVAYNNWATAFNNASQVCKVGETIRDYNGQSFMALHKNVDQVAKAAAAVCSEDDFNAEGSLPNLGSSEKNKAICEKMNNDLAKLSEDSQTSSKQIQCFSSKCQELSGKEATAFADMKAKFETFQANYDKYFAAAEGFNAKVEDKNAKLAAVQAAHVQLAEVKAATGAKFTKDYEVYHKFETGAANGNCGLTACEMESVCGYDIEADASAYVEKDANGKCRGKTVDLVEHCYAEVADDKAKAAAEAAAKAAAEKAAAEKAAAEKAAAEKAAAEKAAAEKAAAEKAAAEGGRRRASQAHLPLYVRRVRRVQLCPVNVIDGTPASCVGHCSLRYEDGKVGARALDTSNGAKVLMGPIDYSVTAHYSVCAWLKTNARISRWQTAIGNWGKGYDIMHFGLDSGNNPEFADYSGATGKWNKLAAGPRGSFEVGRWTHVCEAISTGDGGKKQMWVDGKLTGEISNEGAPAYAQRQGTFNMVIGDKWEHGGNTWKGAIDDVMMWDFAITQEEVKAAFDGQPAAIPAPAAPQIQRTRVGEFVGQ